MKGRLLAYALAIIALAAWSLVAACKSGDDDTTRSPTAAPSNGTSATASSEPTATSAQSSELAEAGSELSAYHLLDAAGYSAALGEPVTVEDNGVVPDQYGCEVGQARALTAAGVLITTSLRTAASTDNAKDDYTSQTNSGSIASPLSGVGDQSAYADGIAVVQKGAQVLRVTSAIAPGIDPKANGADPTAALAAAAAAAGKAAPALAEKMGGAACTGPALGIPEGGVNPCQMSASTFGDAVGIDGATAEPVISDEPPAQECAYNAPGIGTVYTYVATHAVLEASILPTTAQDMFTTRLTSATNAQAQGFGEYDSFSEPPFQAFGNVQSPGVGIDSTIIYQGDSSTSLNIDPGPIHQAFFQNVEPLTSIILRILESSSGLTITSPDQCEKMMSGWLDDALGKGSANGPPGKVAQQYEDAKKALIDYCNKSVKAIDLSVQ
jgi:hypothetical protein